MPESSHLIAQGQRLAQLRKAKNMSAQSLADAMSAQGAKVSRGAISNWERGSNGIVSSKLAVLVQILETSEQYLLTGVETNLPSTDTIAQTTDTTKTSNPTVAQSKPDTSYSIITSTESAMTTLQPIKKSSKLDNVCYEIRGPLMKAAAQMEEQGHRIIKLNIGNPAPFGFEAPQEILRDVARNLPRATGYSESKGIFSARKAILQYYQSKGLLEAVDPDDVYLGNGVSELIVMAMQALLNDRDEVLIPKPDYPLWTAATNLAGGKAVHYLCDEADNWQPSIEDIRKKITSRTRAIVVINPNNPTGSVYSLDILKQIVELARQHNLVLMADEIYDRILYDDAQHTPICTLAKDCLVLSFNGLSKSHRIAGFRAGWLMLSGQTQYASDFIEGLDMLASMRLCSNVQAQYAIQTSLGGYQSIEALTAPGGRLYTQRNIASDRLNDMVGVSCVKPQGALYCFAKLDPNVYPITDDTQFMMEFLRQQNVLMVQGTGFNWDKPDHFRLVFLPAVSELNDALNRLEQFLAKKRQQFGTD